MQRRRRRRKKKETTFGMTFSKKMLVLLLINAGIIEVYAMALMWRAMDTSALYALIGAGLEAAIAFTVYCAKSAVENKKGGIIYETAMKTAEKTSELEGRVIEE